MIKRASWLVVAATVLATLGTTRQAHAQLAWTAYGVGEFDTGDVVLVLGGVSVAPTRAGWTPIAGLSASWLQYPVNTITDETRSVTTITPSIGIANNFEGGSAQFRVGYAFSDSEDDIIAPVVGPDAGKDGIVNIAQVDYWGNGNLGAQAIASYNYAAESIWTRGRLTHRIFGLGDDGHIRAGGEVAYNHSEGYSATQVGGVLGFHPGRGAILTAGVGRKLSDDTEDATYFRFELVLTPGR